MRGKQFLKEKGALLSGVAAAVLIFLVPLLTQAQTQIATNFIGGAALDLGYTLMNAVLVVIQSALGLLVFIGATILNLSIKIMLNFNTIVESIPAINETWRILRDVGFMFFIFIILYHSILYILGFGTGALKTLGNIILVGILINFSMFFTKVMIDASNVVSLQFYKSIQIQDNVIPTDSLLGSFSNNVMDFKTSLDGGVGFAVMQALRLPSLYDPSGIEKGGAGISGVRVIVALIMSCIVMFITAGILLAAGFMFIIRIGILLILLVFSPIPFLALVMDKLKGEATKWWSTLIDQLVFPPVFLCILYITLRIASSPGYKQLILANNPTFSNIWFAGSAEALFGGIMVILNYSIIIIFLGIAMKSANQFGGDAAKIGLQYANKVKSWSKSQAASTGKWAQRQTIGFAASKIADSERVRDFAASRNLVVGSLGKTFLKGARSVADGYNKNVETKSKAEKEFADSLGYNKEDAREAQDRINRHSSDLTRIQQIEKQMKIARETDANYATNANYLKLEASKEELARKYDLVHAAEERFDNMGNLSTEAASALTSLQSRKAGGENISDAEMAAAEQKQREAARNLSEAEKARDDAYHGEYAKAMEHAGEKDKKELDTIKSSRTTAYKAGLKTRKLQNLFIRSAVDEDAAKRITIDELKKKKEKMEEKLKDLDKDIKEIEKRRKQGNAKEAELKDLSDMYESKTSLTETVNKIKADLQLYNEEL